LRNEAEALAGESEGVHQMRVAIRRLRAAISGFRKMLPNDQRRSISDELRWLADTLGEARNLDVFERAVVNPARRAVADKSDFRILKDAVRSRQRLAYSAIEAAIQSTRYSQTILRLVRWFDGQSWPGDATSRDLQKPIGEVAPAILDRCRRSVERRCKGFADQPPSERHELRITLKKMRYTAELFGSLYPARSVEEFSQRLKRLQDDLGSANDVHVGETLIQELGEGTGKSAAVMSSGRHVLIGTNAAFSKRKRRFAVTCNGLSRRRRFGSVSRAAQRSVRIEQAPRKSASNPL
jgi:triphosphatase